MMTPRFFITGLLVTRILPGQFPCSNAVGEFNQQTLPLSSLSSNPFDSQKAEVIDGGRAIVTGIVEVMSHFAAKALSPLLMTANS